jgi:c-di-GMP-binding flagellar brake protein YcgR
VARALHLELDLATSRQRSVTIDLSTGGFSALLDKAPPVGDDMGVSLRLPAAAPVVCRARVTDLRPQAGHVRVAARFEAMPLEDRERLELFVFDTVLAQLVR